MRDYLLDVVGHTLDLGCIDLVKIVGTTDKTEISSVSEDRNVIIQAEFKDPVPEFVGTFGMPNLSKLKVLLNLPEYRENAKLSIAHKAGTTTPENLTFENATGDFRNSYRFMAENTVNDRMPTPKFMGATWHVQFEPTVASIQRLRMQAQANAEEPNFQAKTENGDLKFFFGDHSSHAGNFVFQPGVSGQLTRAWSWPVASVIGILSMSGDKTVSFSNDGIAKITVDSGIAVYNYLLPAQSK